MTINQEQFLLALQRNPQAVADLPPDTFRRYAGGRLPRSFQWLLRHPQLLSTLAELAQSSQQSTMDPRLLTKHPLSTP